MNFSSDDYEEKTQFSFSNSGIGTVVRHVVLPQIIAVPRIAQNKQKQIHFLFFIFFARL
jgi:hypothetical protein